MFPILVKDENGNVIENAEWLLVKGLLKYNLANLCLELPATIQLDCRTNTYLKLKNKQINFSYAKPKKFYGSILFRSVDGIDMFRSDSVKTAWYLSRNLVTPVNQDPPVVQFNKKTNGMGCAGDEFYLNVKKDQCVVCGCKQQDKKLTRHHVMPHMFRKYMPDKIKGRSYHDIVLLCIKCHREYETKADILKNELYSKYKIPENKTPSKFIILNEINKARGLATAILVHGDKIPEKRLLELKQEFEQLSGLEPAEESLLKFSRKKQEKKDNPDFVDLGKWVVDRIEDIQEFAVLWRKHFLQCMNPQFMPEFWCENRSVFRLDSGE